MGRSIELSGNSVVYLFYASSLAIVPVLTYFVVLPLDGLDSVLAAILLAALVLVAAVDCWYWKTGKLSDHLTAAARRRLYDITYDPFADPGRAAGRSWRAAIRRSLGGDDDEE
ncbi:hypothetical protein [Halorussus salinus]|uniref:hypothetical protein n=1 Tax=Halorussus salinus TaxID=1364935 RepID=UPI001091AA20|nr:hypothetical protein [Halorussus salinus]